MADRTLYPRAPSDVVLIPASVEDAEPHVRAWLAERYAGDPVHAGAYWEMLPGSGDYCAMVDYRASNPTPPGMPWMRNFDPLDLAEHLANIYFGKRVYALNLVQDYSRRIEAYQRYEHRLKNWKWFDLPSLRKAEPGMPTDPWDFAAWKGVVIERPPPLPPPPPVRSVSLVEGATIVELEPLKRKPDIAFHPVDNGICVTGKGSAKLAIDVAYDLKKDVYLVKVFPTRDEFTCWAYHDGIKVGQLRVQEDQIDPDMPDSIRGETTLPGILRALGIPFELAGLAPDGTILPDAP